MDTSRTSFNVTVLLGKFLVWLIRRPRWCDTNENYAASICNEYMPVSFMQDSLNWSIVTKKWNYFLIVQSNNQCKWTFTASWSKTVTVNTLRTGKTTKYWRFCNYVLSCRAPTFLFWGIFPCIQHFSSIRCQFYKGQSYHKIAEKQQGPALYACRCPFLSGVYVNYESIDCSYYFNSYDTPWAMARFFVTRRGGIIVSTENQDPCKGVRGYPPQENFQIWKLQNAIFSTCHEICLRKIDLKYENGKHCKSLESK